MKVLIVLSVCVALACAASPSRSAPESQVEAKDRTKRDHPVDSYAAPPPQGHGDGGVYYYYYPTEMMPKEMEEEDKKKDKCAVEKLLPPIILITIFLGIIAGAIVGLFPSLTFPTFQQLIPALNQIANGRAMDDMTEMITRAVESDDCLPRLICESGKFADGYTTMVSLFEFFTPRGFESKMKIFKDSALKKTDCKRYRCSYVDGKPK
ncbi:uncharacterized protein LOC125040799 [Penaeus chinensis]|uniref:uncharacterized protein LOC125040799 n=1 Tax=Penaeus chinensis TaxID=139456 RepID=UPI001FB73E21|nr:uncharacterized protein LOC125040799 [Penaeus chinensis]XP_047491484.1 uncharacterized protein LOC125040799 [Penaeus chinensis]